MPKTSFAVYTTLALLAVSTPTLAQGPREERDSASPSTVVASIPSGAPIAPPTAPTDATPKSTTPSDPTTPAPFRGPSVRDRSARRSRGSSMASGALMIALIAGALVYYVVKKIRR